MVATKLDVLWCASECAPYAKTGGLADVVEAVPRYLRRRGHDVRVVLPLYRSLIKGVPWSQCRWFAINPRSWGWQGGNVWIAEHRPEDPDEPTIYFIENTGFFDRAGVYGDAQGGFGDNDYRYAFLCSALLDLAPALNWAPHIYHLNDWHTALVAAMARRSLGAYTRPDLAKARFILSVHNMAHRGLTSLEVADKLNLPSEVRTWQTGEYFGAFSFLKAGLAYADVLSTVSPSYAHEILTHEHGFGLDPLLRERKDRLVGILNGIDDDAWNPATDPHLEANYDAEDVRPKVRNKLALQKMLDLPQRPDVPLFAMISRLDAQKGHELVINALPTLLREDVQVVILGTGSANYAANYMMAERVVPSKMRALIRFSGPLSHLIEAAADFFLMPSSFEPCGLNQMYSMRYGTPPIVRRVGGLRDSVRPIRMPVDDSVRETSGTGFGFDSYTTGALLSTIGQALGVYRLRPDLYRQLQHNGMSEPLGWKYRVVDYEELYAATLRAAPYRPL